MTDPVADRIEADRESVILDLAKDALFPVVEWTIEASREAIDIGMHLGHKYYLQLLAGGLAGMKHRVRFAISPVIEFAWKVSPAGADAAAACFADMFVDEFKKEWTLGEHTPIRPFVRRLRSLDSTLPSQWALRLVLALRQGRSTDDEIAPEQPGTDTGQPEGESDAVPE